MTFALAHYLLSLFCICLERGRAEVGDDEERGEREDGVIQIGEDRRRALLDGEQREAFPCGFCRVMSFLLPR